MQDHRVASPQDIMLKQTLRALIVGLTVMPYGYGQQPVRMEVPAVTAKTNLASKSIGITRSGYSRTEQDSRQMSVNVEVRFFHAPSAPYELQCFFISKNEYTKKMQVFDGMRKTAQGQVFTWQFMSQPIAGSTRKFTSVPFLSSWAAVGPHGAAAVAGGIYATNDSYSERSGYKIEGWVVRIVGQGNVLRVESNQPALQQIAQSDEMTRQLDAIAARLGDEQKDGPMRFAPDARVVVPGTIFSTPPPLAPPASTRSIPAAPARIAVVPAPPVPGAALPPSPLSPALLAPPALGTVIPAPAAVGPLVANPSDPSGVRLQSPPGKARNPKSRVAEIKKPQATVFLNDTKNAVFQGADWNSLTPEELALVNGLKIADIGLPKDRGYGYFKLFVMIDDSAGGDTAGATVGHLPHSLRGCRGKSGRGANRRYHRGPRAWTARDRARQQSSQ